MKNYLLGVVAAVILGLVIAVAYRSGLQTSIPVQNTPASITPAPSQQIVGGDKDEHGCIGSAGYSWCPAKSKCLRVWEEGCPSENDAAEITAALIKKHSWAVGSVSVKLQTNDGRYASGSVPGGYVFAAKVNGAWEIVADGNGEITCASLAAYPEFPSVLIPECYDPATGTSVKR